MFSLRRWGRKTHAAGPHREFAAAGSGLSWRTAAAISRSFIGRYGLSQQQAAEKLGKSQPAIANKLRLLRLGPPVTDCLRQYGLTERHARALLRLTDPEQQLAAARHIGQRGLNVAQAEQYIDALAAETRRSRCGGVPRTSSKTCGCS